MVSDPVIALLAISSLLPAAMWCSLRAAATAELDLLPAESRRRIRWWQTHAGHVYVVCVVLAVLGLALHVGTLS